MSGRGARTINKVVDLMSALRAAGHVSVIGPCCALDRHTACSGRDCACRCHRPRPEAAAPPPRKEGA